MHLRVSDRSKELLATLLAEKYTESELITLGAEIGIENLGEIKGIGPQEKARSLVHSAAEPGGPFERLLRKHRSDIESNADLVKALKDDGTFVLLR